MRATEAHPTVGPDSYRVRLSWLCKFWKVGGDELKVKQPLTGRRPNSHSQANGNGRRRQEKNKIKCVEKKRRGRVQFDKNVNKTFSYVT